MNIRKITLIASVLACISANGSADNPPSKVSLDGVKVDAVDYPGDESAEIQSVLEYTGNPNDCVFVTNSWEPRSASLYVGVKKVSGKERKLIWTGTVVEYKTKFQCWVYGADPVEASYRDIVKKHKVLYLK